MSDIFNTSPDPAALQAEALLQATCYSLPYGAMGFGSHLITHYTMIVLILGRTPLYPWRPLQYPRVSAIPGIISLIGTTVVSCISISRCSAEEPFRLMGAWMLMTSIAVSLTSIAAPFALGTTKEKIAAEKEMQETILRERKSFDLIAYARMQSRSDRKFPIPEIDVQLYAEDQARKDKRETGGIDMGCRIHNGSLRHCTVLQREMERDQRFKYCHGSVWAGGVFAYHFLRV